MPEIESRDGEDGLSNWQRSLPLLKSPNIALVARTALARNLLAAWLREVAPESRVDVHTGSGELVAETADDLDLIILGFCWDRTDMEPLAPVLREICSTYRSVPVVIVTSDLTTGMIRDSLRCGARGVIPTWLPVPVAVAAVRLVMSGGVYAPPEAGQVDPSVRTGDGNSCEVPPGTEVLHPALAPLNLSPREAEVLLLLRTGCSNRQIAQKLAISENTVMVHVRHVMQKVGATNRTQAVFKANKMIEQHGRGADPE